MPINSGIRCPEWNKHEGGVSHSYHLPESGCLACDVGISDRRGRVLIVELALQAGLSVGIYPGFLHLDNRVSQVIF